MRLICFLDSERRCTVRCAGGDVLSITGPGGRWDGESTEFESQERFSLEHRLVDWLNWSDEVGWGVENWEMGNAWGKYA